MDHVDYTSQKLRLVLDQIKGLSDSEFPHADPQEALTLLRKLFDNDIDRIVKAVAGGDEATKAAACAQATSDVARFLPILGFCLRSTNVRNSFELFVPLLQLARQLLDRRDTKLILSSEWDFSPFTYPLVIPELPNFVLIGLPASESGNALVIPLSGHELGHSVWRAYGMEAKFQPELQKKVIDALKRRWADFEAINQTKLDVSKVESDMFVRTNWLSALQTSARQVQEMLCDCIAVRIFGESYFHATEYLISPHFGNRRAPNYPDIGTRMRSMEAAADRFKIPHPANFAGRFSEAPCSLDNRGEFLLSLADEATKASVNDILDAAEQIATAVKLPLPDVDAANRIYACFKKGVPASKLANLADVINAGWQAYFDNDLWEPNSLALDRFGPLNELILKTVEVMEFEIRMGTP